MGNPNDPIWHLSRSYVRRDGAESNGWTADEDKRLTELRVAVGAGPRSEKS
jgi:hypothetical protein